MTSYADFLLTKQIVIQPSGIEVDLSEVHASRFDFQKQVIRWQVRKGRAACFAATGLGKAGMAIESCRLTAERALILDGAREAWRISRVGILVKVADHCHGGELLALSDWVKDALPVRPYAVLHTVRPGYLRDGKHRVERVPRNNGAVWLAFRKTGHRHVDFDRLYQRQVGRTDKKAS